MGKGPILKLFTADNLVSKGPTWFFAAIISGDGAAADCDIHDGIDTDGTKRIHLEAASGETEPCNFGTPIMFKQGIYLNVNAATTNVMIAYLPARDKPNKSLQDLYKD